MVKKTIKEEKITKKNSLKENIVSEEWKKIKLGNLFNISSSRRVLQSQWKSNGVPFYRGREITALSKNGEVDNKLFISKELYNEYASKYGIPKTSDIMITAIGTIGNSYVVKETDKFYFKDASVLWLNKKSDVDSEFINYWLKSREFFQQLDKGNGSTVDTLTVERLQNVLCTLPASPEQKQIVTILSNVDNLINSTQKIIDQTKSLNQGLMQKLLIKGIGHKKFKKVKWYFGKEITIPEEWKIVNVKNLVVFHKQGFYTTQLYSDDGIKIVRVNDLHSPNLSYETMKHLELDQKTFDSFKISKGDFLIARTGNIGNYGIVKEDVQCIHISDIIRFVFNQKILLNEYLGIFFESHLLLSQLLMIQQSSSHIHINAETIKSIIIPLPTLQEQKKIISIFSNIDFQINSQTQYKEKLERLKKSLMQKLLTGEVRVIV